MRPTGNRGMWAPIMFLLLTNLQTESKFQNFPQFLLRKTGQCHLPNRILVVITSDTECYYTTHFV